MEHASIAGCVSDADRNILPEICEYVDNLLRMCEHDTALSNLSLKFKIEHAARKVEHQVIRDQQCFSKCEVRQLDNTQLQQGDGINRGPPPSSQFAHLAPEKNFAAPGRESVTSAEREEGETGVQGDTSSNQEMMHFFMVLQRMSELAVNVAQHVLKRTEQRFAAQASYTKPRNPFPNNAVYADERLAGPPVGTEKQLPITLRTSSSAEELSQQGSDQWIEAGATLHHCALEILSLVLVVHRNLTYPLQMYLVDQCKLLEYIDRGLAVERDHELQFFADGYKTALVRLLANLTYHNEASSKAVAANERLFSAALRALSIDEDNPGMREWAVFAVRNICSCAPNARDIIRNLHPVGLSEESQRLLRQGTSATFTPTGKVRLETHP